MFEKLRLKLKERQFYRDYERLTIHIYESALAANSFEEISDKVSMLKSLADDGVLDSRAQLGCLYAMEGKPWFDASLAKKYLRMDAEAGNAAPQFNMGLLYYNGTLNTGSDPVSGLFWVNKSAEQKFPYALDFLSKRENGRDK